MSRLNRIIKLGYFEVLFWAFQKPRVLKYKALSDIDTMTGSPRLVQPALFSGKGKVVIGEGVVIGSRPSPFLFSGYAHVEARGRMSVVLLGDRVWINNNFVCISNGGEIHIGADTLIGSNVEIYDSDFHEIAPDSRRSGRAESRNIYIGSKTWIGSNTKILKGVSIGDNSIIGNSSIVIHSIPANVIASGSPAKVIRDL